MSRPERPRGRVDLFYQDVTDGGVLFDPEGERMIVLNPTAAFVWSCCDGEHSVDEIAQALAESIGPGAPDLARLQRDVRQSLEEFRTQGLLVDP